MNKFIKLTECILSIKEMRSISPSAVYEWTERDIFINLNTIEYFTTSIKGRNIYNVKEEHIANVCPHNTVLFVNMKEEKSIYIKETVEELLNIIKNN